MTSQREMYKFRLFVAGETQNTAQALNNLKAICKSHLPNLHEIEVVDVLLEPNRALLEGIFLTPTLIRVSPRPTRKIVGTLGVKRTVAQVLGLDVTAA